MFTLPLGWGTCFFQLALDPHRRDINSILQSMLYQNCLWCWLEVSPLTFTTEYKKTHWSFNKNYSLEVGTLKPGMKWLATHIAPNLSSHMSFQLGHYWLTFWTRSYLLHITPYPSTWKSSKSPQSKAMGNNNKNVVLKRVEQRFNRHKMFIFFLFKFFTLHLYPHIIQMFSF